MIYQSKQFKQITFATVALLFVWPFGSWGASSSESRVYINESVKVEANSGGNYLNINGNITELKTAPAAVRVKIKNIINGQSVAELNVIQDKAGEILKKAEYVSPDENEQVRSEVQINNNQQLTANNQPATVNNFQSEAQASEMPLNNSQQSEIDHQTPIGGLSEERQSTGNNLLTVISNFFSDIFKNLIGIFQ